MRSPRERPLNTRLFSTPSPGRCTVTGFVTEGNGGELFDPSVKLASRYIPELPLKQPDVLGVERPYHVSVTKLP